MEGRPPVKAISPIDAYTIGLVWMRRAGEADDVVVVSREEWERFIEDSDKLIQKYEELLRKYKDLTERHEALEERARRAEERLQQLEIKMKTDLEETTRALRRARANMARLLEEVVEREVQLPPRRSLERGSEG